MTHIYVLSKNDKHPVLVQDDSSEAVEYENDFAIRAASPEMHGTHFPSTYSPLKLKIAAETARRKGISDLQTHFSPFIIFTQRAADALSDLLDDAGQLLPVVGPQQNLIGFHVTRILDSAVDFDKSAYVMYENGPLIRKTVLLGKAIEGVHIFKIRESTSRVFVSDVFRQRVEERKLNGFSFLQEVTITY